jgi:hypothetical protein
MSIVVVETDSDYLAVLAEIDRLAEADDEDIGLLQEFIRLAATYELRRFPPEPAETLSTCPWHRKAA